MTLAEIHGCISLALSSPWGTQIPTCLPPVDCDGLSVRKSLCPADAKGKRRQASHSPFTAQGEGPEATAGGQLRGQGGSGGGGGISTRSLHTCFSAVSCKYFPSGQVLGTKGAEEVKQAMHSWSSKCTFPNVGGIWPRRSLQLKAEPDLYAVHLSPGIGQSP